MQPLEALKIAIKERIFIVPFDLQCKHAVFVEDFYVIDLVRQGSNLMLRIIITPLDEFLDRDIPLAPTSIGKCPAHTLRTLSFTSSSADKFCYRYRKNR